MLERLNKVRWRRLQHAYGPASDVPELIRGLASSSREAREKARDELYITIWHQGQVFEATAYAVPFLLELLSSDDVADKQHILILLAALGNGHTFADLNRHLSAFQLWYAAKGKTVEWQERHAQQLTCVEKASEAVRSGMPSYLRFLSDPAWQVRDAAAFLLGALRPPTPAAADELKRRLSIEEHETVKASLLLAFGLACQPDEAARDTIAAALSDADAKPVRLAAAVSLVRFARERVSEPAMQALLDSLENPDDYSALQHSCFLDGDGVVSFVAGYLALLKGDSAQRVLEPLLKALPLLDHLQAVSTAAVLLQLVFPEPVSPDTALQSLDQKQRRVLECLAANRNFWGVETEKGFIGSANAGNLMHAYNLPSRLSQLIKFVGGEQS